MVFSGRGRCFFCVLRLLAVTLGRALQSAAFWLCESFFFCCLNHTNQQKALKTSRSSHCLMRSGALKARWWIKICSRLLSRKGVVRGKEKLKLNSASKLINSLSAPISWNAEWACTRVEAKVVNPEFVQTSCRARSGSEIPRDPRKTGAKLNKTPNKQFVEFIFNLFYCPSIAFMVFSSRKPNIKQSKALFVFPMQMSKMARRTAKSVNPAVSSMCLLFYF